MASLYHLCKAENCNRKYKTFDKYKRHMLTDHEQIIDDDVVEQPIAFTSDNRKRIENERNNRSKNEEIEALKQKVLLKKAAEAAAEREHLDAESERYRLIQEQALQIREEEISFERRRREAIEYAEKSTQEFMTKCHENAAQSSDVCCICFEDPRDTATIPCGHRYFCEPCISKYHQADPRKGCPMCRADIVMVRKIYL